MSARRTAHGSAGFTLLEVLVALAIAAIVVLAEVAPFQRAIASRDRAEAALDRTSAARITLQRIAEEVQGAVPVPGRRFAVADTTFDLPSSDLTLATTASHRLSSGPRDPIEMVRYHLEPPARGETGGRLVKEQLPSVASAGVEPLRAVVLEGVAGFRARVLPRAGQPWADTWQGGDGGKPEDLPRAVELEIALADPNGEAVPFHLAVTLPMAVRR
ncbi:MAG TPA: type II secretion system protein GspJ [Candidatus Binatia bacterium]|nr:type II secretion system protein GspJ [Candidatus Binatia bacterium]